MVFCSYLCQIILLSIQNFNSYVFLYEESFAHHRNKLSNLEMGDIS